MICVLCVTFGRRNSEVVEALTIKAFAAVREGPCLAISLTS
jgi:hypothetical protein